jgi:hypothetical protein
VTAAFLAAVIVFLVATLPPAPRQAAWSGDPTLAARTVSGAYHVHTTRSDGAKDRAAIAAEAGRAGLQFVIFTDHGDGTREPEAPAYLSGVLCLDGVEISTNGGHYVALGMPRAPYPLGGEASAVVEDVARLGGTGIAAHPDSPRPELAWTDWTLPITGVEWLSADTEWRNETWTNLARVMFDYLLRPGPALATMLDRPEANMERWDALTTQRPVVALAGHDAHGGIGRGLENGGRGGVSIPSYEASFRSFSTRAVLDTSFSGKAVEDAHALLDAITAGRVFTVIDAIATPGLLDLRPVPAGIFADASRPPGGELVLLRNGKEVARSTDGPITGFDQVSGAFRVEVRVPGAPGHPPVPWLVSNPIYLLPLSGVAPQPSASATPFPIARDVPWGVEHDPSSSGTVAQGKDGWRFEYELGQGSRGVQVSALAAEVAGRMPAADRLTFTGRASRPMRISVQLRYPAGVGERWAHSVFLDSTPREVTVEFDDLLPRDGQTGPQPEPSTARSLLFVADLTNANPGDRGVVTISNLAFARARGH